jgi:hypothetical protein
MGEYQRKLAARQRLARTLTASERAAIIGGVPTRSLASVPASVLIEQGRAAAEKAALKGKFDGNCNRTACQTPIRGLNWWNVGTRAYYCQRCADLINEWPAQRGEALICFAVEEPVR